MAGTLQVLRSLYKRVKDFGLTARPNNSFLAFTEIKYLGYSVKKKIPSNPYRAKLMLL